MLRTLMCGELGGGAVVGSAGVATATAFASVRRAKNVRLSSVGVCVQCVIR